MPIWHSVLILNSNSVLNEKALVGAFYQEKALVGAFSVIVKTDCRTDGSFYSANPDAPIYSVQHTTSHTPLLPTWVGLFGNTKYTQYARLILCSLTSKYLEAAIYGNFS